VVDEEAFDHYVRRKHRIGWLVNRLLLAEIGPYNHF
jgi:hypothetical protein